ncbi:MAG: FG-GAP repeat protein [Planctomycetes bacterium]|nr:FG-GAP repeat protein [Planctomycetota bacterium]
MTNNTGKQRNAPRFLRGLLGLALALGGLTLAGCGGGGGGSSSGGLRVQSISPSTGPFIGGIAVTIQGASFLNPGGEPNVVTIGGQPCTDVVTVDASTITCVTPAGTPGVQATVRVTTTRGSAQLFNGFRYFEAIPPRSDLNGDGIADLIVASPLDDTAGIDAGAVFVFFGSSESAGLVDRTAAAADLRILGQNAGDGFGTSICAGDVDGDGQDDLVIGANLVDNASAPDAGAVYVFHGPFVTGSTIPALANNAKLLGETAVSGDRFGTMVELGDVDGDGVLDICAAAPQHDRANPVLDPTALDTGCVYVFEGGASLASRSAAQADRKLDGERRNDRLGNAIAFGDLDGDGLSEMAVGCAQSDPSTPVYLQNAGCVYVVHCGGTLTTGSIEGQAPFVLTGEAAEDRFGSTVAIGDVDGDGLRDLLVGAPSNDYYEFDGGRVYVFHGGAGFASRIGQLADTKLSGMATHNSFGQTLRATDLDGDGITDLLIGAPHADYLNDGNGRAYLFYGGPTLVDSVAVQADAMFNGENSQDDQLGTALSVVDINGDHIADLVMTAARNSFGAGRVYLFLSPATGQHMASSADILFNGAQAQGLFGSAVAEGE